jgi:hypothetical protein
MPGGYSMGHLAVGHGDEGGDLGTPLPVEVDVEGNRWPGSRVQGWVAREHGHQEPGAQEDTDQRQPAPIDRSQRGEPQPTDRTTPKAFLLAQMA